MTLPSALFVMPAVFTFTSVVYAWPAMTAGWSKIGRRSAALLSLAI
jgi:hypothetical protein